MEFSRQAHCIYYTRYHLVFVTKYRRKIFKAGVGAILKWEVRHVERYCPEIEVIEVNTDSDHVHILAGIAPKLSVSHAVNIFKSNTGRRMRERFTFLAKVYHGGEDGIWSPGYFVSTVGMNEEIIKAYIEQQGQEDSGRAKLVLG